MIDLAASIVLVVTACLVGLAHASRRGRAMAYDRVERDGGSILLDTTTMNAGYWALQPVGRACVRLGISANAVTLGSLVLAFGAGILLATGHFGLAAVVAVLASLGDALDGLVARESNTASPAGEVLDATVDRYSEFFFLGGLAVHYRDRSWALLLTLGALAGAFMVSYASAKAEALGVDVPRGPMRRPERATYLGLGAVLVPFATVVAPRWWPTVPTWAEEAPMLAALALVAVLGNASAVSRLSAIARAVTIGPEIVASPRRPPARSALVLARHQLGALMATLIDFGTMTALVEVSLTSPVEGTLIGASLGGLTNFVLGRSWIFGAVSETATRQAMRYLGVAAASAGLNALGEHLVHDRLGVQYVAARTAVAIAVSLAWNFPMQRWFVFRPRPAPAPARDGSEGRRSRS